MQVESNSCFAKLTDVDLSSIPYYAFKVGKFARRGNVIISLIQVITGAGGFELYFYPSAAEYNLDSYFSKLVKNLVLNQVGLGRVIHSDWKWASVSMAMI